MLSLKMFAMIICLSLVDECWLRWSNIGLESGSENIEISQRVKMYTASHKDLP